MTLSETVSKAEQKEFGEFTQIIRTTRHIQMSILFDIGQAQLAPVEGVRDLPFG